MAYKLLATFSQTNGEEITLEEIQEAVKDKAAKNFGIATSKVSVLESGGVAIQFEAGLNSKEFIDDFRAELAGDVPGSAVTVVELPAANAP